MYLVFQVPNEPFKAQFLKVSHCATQAQTIVFNFWHLGTLAFSPERQSARMSEIKNGKLGLYGIEHSKCNCMVTLGWNINMRTDENRWNWRSQETTHWNAVHSWDCSLSIFQIRISSQRQCPRRLNGLRLLYTQYFSDSYRVKERERKRATETERDRGMGAYNGLFLVFAELCRQLEVSGAHHSFMYSQVRKQLIILHYVARHLAELAKITLTFIDYDCSTHWLGSAHKHAHISQVITTSTSRNVTDSCGDVRELCRISAEMWL